MDILVTNATSEPVAVLVAGPWELYCLAVAVEEWAGPESNLAKSMCATIVAAASELPVPPCLCGEIHPQQDCPLVEDPQGD